MNISHRTKIRRAAIPAIISFIALCLTGCDARSPVPQGVIDALKAYVESDRQDGPSEDIFAMPSVNTDQPAGDRVEVTNIRYDTAPPEPGEDTRDIPPGTMLYTYELWDTRTHPNGVAEREQHWFYVYADSSGHWHFCKRAQSPYHI